MNVATAPRRESNIRRRRIIYFGYFGTRKILRLLAGNRGRVVQHVLYYPAAEDATTLADLVNRISWYLPASALSRVKVSIMADTNLLDTNPKSLVPPTSQQGYIGRCENIHLIDNHRVNLSQADAIMLWNKRNMFDPRILSHLAKVNVVDPTFYSGVESETSRSLYFQTIDNREKERFSELSRKNYQSLLDKVSGCNKGYVFGTGPSLDRAMEFDYRGGFCVVCNSIVRNKALLRHIRPQLLVFADPVFHFSPCRYSAEFRQMMLETVERYQCHIMVPNYNVSLYLAHYPQLENRIIGIPGYGKQYNFPTLDKFYVRSSGNIMTLFMLPVASSIVKEIYIIGADGRKPGESYFWTHSSSSQLGDLMQTAFDTHPSFFRDQVYTDYYEEHCKFLEGLVHYGESLGKRYYTLAPSYIPVLAQRPAPGGKE